MQYSDDVRNAKLDAIRAAVGPSPIMQIMTGEKPSLCSSRSTGELLAVLYLPVEWMESAENGSVKMAGSWSGKASNSGEPGYFRIFPAEGPSCKLQGSIGQEMKLNQRLLTAGQMFVVTAFTIRDNNR